MVVLALAAQTARAVENAWDYTVLVNATVQTSPPQITLRWSQDTVAVFHRQNRLPCRDLSENGDGDSLVQRSGGGAPQTVKRSNTA